MMLGSQRGHWESARIPFFPTTRRSTHAPLPRLVRISSLCTRHCCYHGGASMWSEFPSANNTKAFWNAFKQKRYLVIPEMFYRRFFKLNDYTKRHYIALKTNSLKLASSRTNHRAFWSIDKLVEASKDANSEIYRLAIQMLLKQWRYIQLMMISGSIIGTLLVVSPANAIDALKTCTCLLKECRIELAKCISNPSCAANVACLQTCNNRPDETECQIKCGDLFENSVVDEFNECAVSRKKCVPRKLDVGEFPIPASSALVTSFNISDFSGKWYITSGLNPTFDTFDCQLHEFHVESDRVVGNLTWRIRTPDGGFFTRSATQMFKQDPLQPGILYNHDNEYLHYQDDWYILSSRIENKPDDYIFVYYRGRNDAWDGYGGAFVYTRSATLPQSIVPELQGAAKSVGRDFSTFITTDNSCGPEPPLVERLEKTVEAGEETILKEVEEIEGEVEKLEKTELTLLQKLVEGFQEVERDAENFLRGLSKEEMEVLRDLNMEAEQIEKVFGQALPIRKLR